METSTSPLNKLKKSFKLSLSSRIQPIAPAAAPGFRFEGNTLGGRPRGGPGAEPPGRRRNFEKFQKIP